MKELVISITDKKINRTKTRIIQAFLDFFNNKNFSLLENRIKFLTGNYSIRENDEGQKLKAGNYYNYPEINDNTVLEKLNIFFRKALFSKSGKFGKSMLKCLNDTQRGSLLKYSFDFGYKNKVHHSFSKSDLNLIINCWR